MDKLYIIKNCPAYNDDEDFSCRNETIEPLLCQDCTDCVMKQIVDECNKYIENYNDKVFYDDDDVKILMGKVMLSQSILSELLDIEECEG